MKHSKIKSSFIHTIIFFCLWICPSGLSQTPTPVCVHHGDCNADGNITAGDAQMAFMIALGLYFPDYEEACASDCNENGAVTAGDAQLIFSTALGLTDCSDIIVLPTPTSIPVPDGFVFISPGSFMMGSQPDEPCRSSFEDPRHLVGLTRGFHMMQTEVTRQMWADLQSVQPTLPTDPSDTAASPSLNHPVQNTTWFEAVLFANLRSSRNGCMPCYYQDAGFTIPIDSANYMTGPFYCNFSADGYRLPTEAEWEYACRAGTLSTFSCNELSYTSENCLGGCIAGIYLTFEQYSVFCANDPGSSATVGSKLPNSNGLYDMHGNVWEWCWDWYGEYSTRVVIDPTGPESGSDRAVRGGGWGSAARRCRSACRNNGLPTDRDFSLGFRLVQTAQQSDR